MGIGKLCESRTTTGVTGKNYYDSYGRAVSRRTDIANGPSMAHAVAYDSVSGRVASQTYPTGLKVNLNYTTTSALSSVTLATSATVTPLPANAGGAAGATMTLPANSVLWQATSYGAAGNVEKQLDGNGIVNTAVSDP